MKLHGNARTCPKSRKLLVERIVEEGWSLTAAAEAAGVSERTAAQVARALARRGRGRPARSLLGAEADPAPHAAERVEAIEALRRLRHDSRRDRRGARDGALDRLAVAEADRARQALTARATRAAQPLRAQPPGRARPRRHQEARADLSAGRRPAAPAHAEPDPPRRPAARGYGWEFVHVWSTTPRRLAYAEVLADERGADRRRLPAPRASPGSPHAASSRARDDRQRLLLPLRRPRPRLPRARPAPPRTRPYRPRTNGKAERFIQTLLERWAYGADLRQLGRAHRGAARLARPLQLQRDDTAPSATGPPAARLAS